jgi:mycothiol synthase
LPFNAENHHPSPAIVIRPYRPADVGALSRINQRIYPENDTPCSDLASGGIGDRLVAEAENGGRAWVVQNGDLLAGFAYIAPTPGLKGVFDLYGGVDPQFQRQGIGSQLLDHILNEMKGTAVRQIAHCVSSLEDQAGRFLLRRGFHIDHEEWRMELDDLSGVPPAVFRPGTQTRTFPLPEAVSLFRRLYRASFSGLPWYQPYESDEELAAEVADPADLRFLFVGQKPVGFLWLRLSENDTAEIEPVGIVTAYQGQGFGRQLVLHALNQLVHQGINRAALGVWRSNDRAVQLYRQLGFRRTKNRFFLAFDL